MNISFLEHSPSVFDSYKKLVLSKKKGVPTDGKLPEVGLSLKDVMIETDILEAYNLLCNFKASEFIPITFPYVLAGPLHLALLAQKDFPLKGAGLLHLRNRISYKSFISPNDTFDLIVKTSETRFRPQGFEFDILTEVIKGQEIVWTCKSTLLSRGKFAKEDPASTDEELFNKFERSDADLEFKVPGNAGKKYAKLCKDYNPIHIATPLAWLFGFKKSIAHGMWVSARALGEMNIPDAKEFDLAFKGPVYTGSKVSVQKENEHFNLFCSGNKRPVILGRVI